MPSVQNFQKSGINHQEYSLNQKEKANFRKTVSFGSKKDSVELSSNKNIKENKSNNGKFDISECAKNFFKGVISPITAIVKHPIITIGTVAATAALCACIPVMGPILAVGFGALGAFQLGKGVVDVVKNYKNGDFDKAEKSFNEVGQGTTGIAMTILGVKQNAKVAKEAKMMSDLNINSLNKAQKAQIANEVKELGFMDAIKETASLFTSKTGLKAVGKQFKPSNIMQRAKDAFKFLFTKEEVKKVKKEKMAFKDTTEGKRRASLTTEEIEKEVKALYKEACDECGIEEGLRPQIKITKESVQRGGGYNSSTHTIEVNENSYKAGIFDLPDVIKHESTHASEAILRQRLPMEEKERLTVEYLLDKIQNGDKENILTGEANFISGAVKVKLPKMNTQMKADFAKLAQEKLYQLTDYSNDEITSMVKPLVESNPEFVKGYSNMDDAINAMANYAKNHNFRYKLAMKHSSGFNTTNVDVNLLKELSEEEKIAAIKSFKESVDCLESNIARKGDIFGMGGDFNQYQFTPEEVLAQQKGNNFEISKLQAQLDKLRSSENYDIAEEARLLDQIKKSELTIEYKTKGQEMYKLQTESFNHPEDIDLANKVKAMQDELSAIQEEIESIQGKLTTSETMDLYRNNRTQEEVMHIVMNNPTNEYTQYTELKRPPMGADINIPPTVTNAADIIGDDIKKEA